jgi:hypothetical protein
MLQTLWATVHDGHIQLAEPVALPEGAKLIVTVLPDQEDRFWVEASQVSLNAVWDNAEDDVYAQLLSE